MIRLIAIDMDGTLLTPDHTLSKVNREAILAAKEQGIEVFIATGRNYGEALDPFTEHDPRLPYICLNGAEVRDVEGNLLAATYLPEAPIYEILNILNTHHIDSQLFIDKIIYTKDIQDQIDTYVQLAEDKGLVPNTEEIRREVEDRVERGIIQIVDSFDPILKEYSKETYKILGTSFNREDLKNARMALEQIPNVVITSSGAGNIEITHKDAQKGIALAKIAESKGISMEEVMVIGDNYNDLSMMERAGYAVAMGNAPQEVQDACGTITETNLHDGAGKAIQTVLNTQSSN